MNKTARNERTKLLANALDRASTACVAPSQPCSDKGREATTPASQAAYRVFLQTMV